MAAPRDSKALDKFLNQVDEIESIVKSLNSGDDNVVQSAITRADEMMKKVPLPKKETEEEEEEQDLPKTKFGYSKSCVNKYKPGDLTGSPTDLPLPPGSQNVSQEAFLEVMAKDAAERAERRKQRWKEGDEIKLRGNEEFSKGNYEAALDLYNQAIDVVRDNKALYTNRAQTHIKLGMFDKALVDCEWALKVDRDYAKAYIHQGRAHLGLRDYAQARASYNQALELEPKMEAVIKGYLAEVDRVEEAEAQEENAKQVFESGETHARGVVELLEKVQRANQLPLFYSGGFRIIADLLRNTDQRTLFRTNGGFKLCKEHQTLARCLQASPKSLSKEELEMLSSAVHMYTQACTDNETNQEQLFAQDDTAERLLQMLETRLKGFGKALQRSVVDLLFTLSCSQHGRGLIIAKMDTARLLASMFTLMRMQSNNTSTKTGNLLSNLCLENRLRSHLRDKMEKKILPPFEALLNDSAGSAFSKASCVAAMVNLVNDKAIRTRVASSKETWNSCLTVLENHMSLLDKADSRDLVLYTLGFLMNLSVDVSGCLQEFGTRAAQLCLPLWECREKVPGVAERSLGVLSHVLPHCKEAADWAAVTGGPPVFTEAVKTEDASLQKSGVRCLSACTQSDTDARNHVVDSKGLGALLRLLKSEDELTAGNAALCLSHCVQVDKVPQALSKTDVIKELLVLARDGKRPQVQQNCAILIAKLAKSDPRHLERLRELHGIEILHSCMKYIK